MSMDDGKRVVATPLLFVAIALALGVFGCGVKSTPLPPELVRPEQILDLHAQRVRRGVELTWSRPRRYVSGKHLSDLGDFIIMRSANFGPMTQLAEIRVTDQERFRVQSKFEFLDTHVEPDRFYRYQVVSRTLDDYQSLPSNAAGVAVVKLRKSAKRTPHVVTKPAAAPSPKASVNPMLSAPGGR